MKRIKYLLMLIIAAFIFVPCMKVFAMSAEETVLNEIRITGSKDSVALNEVLTDFIVSSQTDGITVEKYGKNTCWAMTTDKDGKNGWIKLSDGTEAKSSDNHYGLRLELAKGDNYLFGDKLDIYYNNKLISGYSIFNVEQGWVLYVDLGTPISGSNNDPIEPDEPEETAFKVFYNLNGAEWDEEYADQYVSGYDDWSTNYPKTVQAFPLYKLIPPKLKVFDGFEINGVRYAPGAQYTLTTNTTIKILWKDAEAEDYTVENDDFGVTLDFTEVAGKDFELHIETLSMYTDEFIAENIDEEDQAEIKEEIKMIKNSIISQTDKLGTFIDLYMIYLDEDQDGSYHEGPFKIRIKMTEAMKKYNTFKMVYIKDFDDDDADVLDEVIELTVNGDYLEGTLEHLSNYVLLGSVEKNPKTSDNLIIYIILSIFSVIGLISVRKLVKNN